MNEKHDLSNPADIACLAENELLTLARQGNTTAMEQLLQSYAYLVKQKERIYYIPSGDRDDLLQEGMIGLFQAIQNYREEKEVPFPAFAGICIGREMITALRRAGAGYRIPTSMQIPLGELEKKEERGYPAITMAQWRQNPERVVLRREYFREMHNYMQHHLSCLERVAVYRIALGYSFGETANSLGRSKKSIDNALQRVREKMHRSPFVG